MEFIRSLNIPSTPKNSFFLWGPRQTGKSYLLRKLYSPSLYVDLLLSDQFVKYTHQPSRLREEVTSFPNGSLIVIDEIQKVPTLLDEVHWLIENKRLVFALTGSSARKLKREHANMLGGRAIRYELHGLTRNELAKEFDLLKITNIGNLPNHYLSDEPINLLEAYVNDYLKEEILAESLARNLPVFVDFLRAAAISDGEIIDYTNIASDCGVSNQTVKNYYDILTDTLIGFYLPAFTARPKRRVIHSPKFYFFNVGIVNYLCKRKQIEPGSELFGKAFENWIVNELRTFNVYKRKRIDLSYWRLSDGREVDVVLNDAEIAIEIKAVTNIANKHLKGLRDIIQDQPKIKRRIIVSLEQLPRTTEDKIEILPYEHFLEMLWNDEII